MVDAAVCGRAGSVADRKARLDCRMSGQRQQATDDTDQPFELRHSSLAEKKKMFAEQAERHVAKQTSNPFSDKFSSNKKVSRDDPNYGKPVAGSKSEKRGKNAARHINAEVVLLCDMIYQEGQQHPDGTAAISFGDLFQIYTRISNKVVGMLLRARKYGLVDFEGEMLFQRRDDDVPICLIRPIQEVHAEMKRDQEFEVGICHKVQPDT